MGNPKNDGFVFGGTDSRTFGVYLTGVQNNTIPDRDVELVTIPGRNGSLTLDNQRWKNVSVTYSCALASNFAEDYLAFLSAVTSLSGYQVLTDTVYPDRYRLAVLKDQVDPKVYSKNRSGVFDLSFTCKPQRYLKSGDTAMTLTAAGTVRNNTRFAAKPLITVYGSAPGNLTVGAVTVQIKALTDKITLDCETMNAWRQVGDAAPENKNGDIYAMAFPELLPGDNAVRWTGGITRVEIIPRWWTL